MAGSVHVFVGLKSASLRAEDSEGAGLRNRWPPPDRTKLAAFLVPATMLEKRLMGDSVRSKTDVAMRNEVYCKLIAWNLTCLVHAIYELGVSPVFWKAPDRDEPTDILKFPTRA